MDASHRILVVDDSPTARRVTGGTLEEAGYEVITADDGDDAIRLFDCYHPDAVVLDVVLPKKNGFQVCRNLKAQSINEPKILMLTSKSAESDQEWGRRQGADDYLVKPFRADELLESLRRLLASST
ncbi:MAG: response regulator [Planctomycetota bacterium]